MKGGLRDNQDFWSGVMLIAVGMTAVVIARNYPFGTSLRMGPGYFPTVLGSILSLFGLWFLAKAFRSTEKIEPGWSLRALVVIPVSLVLFGILAWENISNFNTRRDDQYLLTKQTVKDWHQLQAALTPPKNPTPTATPSGRYASTASPARSSAWSRTTCPRRPSR